MIKIIAAIDIDNGIGKDGGIPWNYKEDMQFFKETTMGHNIIMGTKTFNSIGKALPGRRNIVLSRSKYGNVNGVEFKPFIEYISRDYDCDNIDYVIGGSEIYKMFLCKDLVKHIILTRIPYTYKCNTFFPIEYLDGFQKYSSKTIGQLTVEQYVRKICK